MMQIFVAAAFAACLLALASAQTFPVTLCAEPFSTYSAGHFLVNVDSKGSEAFPWVTDKDNFLVTLGKNWINLKGDLKPKSGSNKDKILSVDLTFSDKRTIDECYCASQKFLDIVGGRSFANPKYYKIEKLCSPDLVKDSQTNPDNLLFCPKCEDSQCGDARSTRDSPAPIYNDWQFYTLTSGGFSGDGLEVFRKQIKKDYPVNPEETQCTPVITNLPLAQFGCNNLADPDAGFGYGANSKNQKCGFAAWINCQEDLQYLSRSGEPFTGHTADINLNIISCPPTVAPTPYPTWSPTTPYPSTSPTTECELLYQEVKDKNCPCPPY